VGSRVLDFPTLRRRMFEQDGRGTYYCTNLSGKGLELQALMNGSRISGGAEQLRSYLPR
jgi:hypothetical protein